MQITPTVNLIPQGQNGYAYPEDYKDDEFDMQVIQSMSKRKLHLLSEISDIDDRERAVTLNDINLYQMSNMLITFLNKKLANMDEIQRRLQVQVNEYRSRYLNGASTYNTNLTLRANNINTDYDFPTSARGIDLALSSLSTRLDQLAFVTEDRRVTQQTTSMVTQLLINRDRGDNPFKIGNNNGQQNQEAKEDPLQSSHPVTVTRRIEKFRFTRGKLYNPNVRPAESDVNGILSLVAEISDYHDNKLRQWNLTNAQTVSQITEQLLTNNGFKREWESLSTDARIAC